jgi:hypothetical protein
MHIAKKLKQKIDTLHGGVIKCSICEEYKSRADYGSQHVGKFRECKECRSHRNRLQRFGITPQFYEDLLEVQGRKCAICESELKLEENQSVIDHCHKTGEVRGVLCRPCNSAIGLLKDKVSLFTQAARYINEPVARQIEREDVARTAQTLRDYFRQKSKTRSSDMA